MLLIPAIDIKDGRCVRLVQGRMDDATVYSDDPVSQAMRWLEAGARRLHIVDLDGAVSGAPVNADLVGRIRDSCPQLVVQVGGGIRNAETAANYLEAGVDYVILGSHAARRPEFIAEVNRLKSGCAIAALDVRGTKVTTEGWTKTGDQGMFELASEFEHHGACAIIFTDVERDGMLSGFNAESTKELANRSGVPIIASGGIRDLDDIRELLKVSSSGIVGAIAGKSLYEGTLDYADALEMIESYENQ